jgi:PIN domain nuclease of toxin-antitoxin system
LHQTYPCDPLLVAQPIAEPLKLLTVDAVLARYSDLIMLA